MDKRAVKKIGLTMRVDNISGYRETRDALSQDWHAFMKYALPEVGWVPIPNIGNDIVSFLEDWGIQGFILTGGNDIGSSPKRDITEKTILSNAIRNGLPVLGVCRGLQMIQVHFGGKVAQCPENAHAAKEHKITFLQDLVIKYGLEKEAEVNSYHDYGVRIDALSAQLQPFAVTEDGWVEALTAKKYPILAVQWHPERSRPFRQCDRRILRRFFGL